ILARGARAIEQALDAVDAERLGGRAEIRVEIRKMMIETAGRDVEPAGELREFDPGHAVFAQYLLPRQDPVATAQARTGFPLNGNNMVTGSRVLPGRSSGQPHLRSQK